MFADHTAEILYLGEAKRLANRSQRLAILARDGAGCSCPGCTKPITLSEINHAEKDWADGGYTDVNAMAADCPQHNRAVGPKPGQWTTSGVTDGPDTGRAAWTLNTDGHPTRTAPAPPRVNRKLPTRRNPRSAPTQQRDE